MRKQYDFSKAKRNPYAARLKKQITIRLDRPTIDYFKGLAEEMGVPYQTVWRKTRVNIDYHVEAEGNLYSVPYTLIHEEVETRATATVVEIWFKGRRVTSHRRRKGKGGFETKREHMPRSHREHLEWTPSRLIEWASRMGPATGRLVSEILKRRPHPEQGFRSCLGIMQLGRRFSEGRLESACLRAESLSSYSYRTVKNILSSGLDRLKVEAEREEAVSVEHENIRGASYYEGGEGRC